MSWNLSGVVIAFNWLVLGYALAIAATQLLLLGGSAVSLTRTLRRTTPSRTDDIFAHPGTPGLSVLVAAYNEEATIVECLRSVLAQRYPELEVVVVEDGSTDSTFQVIAEAFDLVEVERATADDVPTAGAVLSVHAPRGGGPLVVVRKENAGRVADALNVAINVARMPLVCTLDADSVLDPDALLHVVRPLVERPGKVLAAGGVVRPSNGMRLRRGTVESVELPRRMLVRAQIVEYLRAFMLGRIGWTSLNGLLIISGAFGAYRRCDIVDVGGLQRDSLGQDADLVATLHRLARRKRERGYRMMVVPQAVCWTEVPQHRRDLRRQRRRWAHGLAQVLTRHRGAMLNPRYGRFGMVVLPYHLLFELLGPVVEVLGLPAVLAAWWLGLLNPVYALAVFGLAVGFGLLVSVAAVLADEAIGEHYSRWRDLPALVLAALWETTVLRIQLSWWRAQGLLNALLRRGTTWTAIPRAGFSRAR